MMTRIIIISLLGLTLMFVGGQVAGTEQISSKPGSFELIGRAYSDGEISKADRMLFDLRAIFDAEALPAELKSINNEPIKSGTQKIFEIRANWEELSTEQQTEAAALLARPTLDSVYFSPMGQFAIHYTYQYPDTVPSEDLDMSGVSDYVERIGIYLDSAFSYYNAYLGYLFPPDDGNGIYDVYLLRLGAIYGVTIMEGPGDNEWEDYQSHIQMSSTFEFAGPNDDPEGRIIGAQKVTSAHEYFHAVQLAYAAVYGSEFWWSEGTAVYYEEEVFEEVNDNYSYLPYFFNYPDTFLIDTGYNATYHDYSTFIWPSFLAKKFGDFTIKYIWYYLRNYDVLQSIDSALIPYELTMKDIFPEFTVWNYFTGDRADIAYHNDGADYPDILIDNSLSTPFMDLGPNNAPDGFGSNYIMTYPDSWYGGLLRIGFDGENSVEWGFSYITFKGDSAVPTINCDVSTQGRTDCGIYNFLQYDSILFIPCVLSPWQGSNNYNFDTEINPYGDVDGNAAVNILDITYLINYIYNSGISPKYDDNMGDTNGNGVINLLDVSYLIQFLYFSGPAPCPYEN